MPADHLEKFEPCETCLKDPRLMSAFNVHDKVFWVYLCPPCRKRCQELNFRNTIREGMDVGALMQARASINFEIEGLRERIVAMFFIQEEALRAQVQTALEKAFSDENMTKAIDEIVTRQFRTVLENEVRETVRKAIDKKLGSREFREKITKRVELEASRLIQDGG